MTLTTRSLSAAGLRIDLSIAPDSFAFATSHALEGSTDRILRFAEADETRAAWLLELGRAGVGGFVDGGRDVDGAWVRQRALAETLQSKLRAARRRRRAEEEAGRDAWPWRTACELALGLARGLVATEECFASPPPFLETAFAGPLTPGSIGMDGEVPVILASPLVDAVLGRHSTEAQGASGPSPLWSPPAQADGAPWDCAANRYVLGLILYRLLGGEHPFEGAGLRHALSEAATQEAAPFDETIASHLPAGLQALVLRILSPETSRRPTAAREIAQALRDFLDPKRRAPSRSTSASAQRANSLKASVLVEAAPRARRGKPAGAPPTYQKWLKTLWPLTAGVAVAGLAFAQLGPAPKNPNDTKQPRAVNVRDASPLANASATACASCHPRQAAEWRRSVMAHSVKSPLFNALEMLIEEQVGRSNDCPGGAGILRRTSESAACREPQTGLKISGSGGEHWCVNCHAAGDNLASTVPVWEGRQRDSASASTRAPVRDLISEQALEGISCGFCHQVHGPAGRAGAGRYVGNPSWTSFVTGRTFSSRPEDAFGQLGIANSGYELDPAIFLRPRLPDELPKDDPVVHRRPPAETQAYLRSSEFCGSCHDVRLFGTDTIGINQGEHFKRLRNAYSEWVAYGDQERRRGREPASCQNCHMSAFPGICAPGSADEDPPAGSLEQRMAGICPPDTHFEARAPGEKIDARMATSSVQVEPVATHYFSGVDLPLSNEFPEYLLTEQALDAGGLPLSPRKRRDLLLRAALDLRLEAASRRGRTLDLPITIENVGAGHRVPAGFSQEREIWVHVRVTDGSGAVVYEVGRVDRPDQDLGDKVFLRVGTDPDRLDFQGRPEGLFGADIREGPDAPEWFPPPIQGGQSFRGRGLINFQNGFLRCVTCIGVVASDGSCQPGPGQGFHRADRFADGIYDIDTGECFSNLRGDQKLLETYFPVGALDASRGLVKGPDAIIDTRSLPPHRPVRYNYELDAGARPGPLRVEARLLFRAFPPFLIRAFADYEAAQAARGRRPTGPLVTHEMLQRLEIVELDREELVIP